MPQPFWAALGGGEAARPHKHDSHNGYRSVLVMLQPLELDRRLGLSVQTEGATAFPSRAPSVVPFSLQSCKTPLCKQRNSASTRLVGDGEEPN